MMVPNIILEKKTEEKYSFAPFLSPSTYFSIINLPAIALSAMVTSEVYPIRLDVSAINPYASRPNDSTI